MILAAGDGNFSAGVIVFSLYLNETEVYAP